MVAQLVKKLPAVIESKVHFRVHQNTHLAFPEPDESISHPHTIFISDPLIFFLN
jgi:hypothetical protein